MNHKYDHPQIRAAMESILATEDKRAPLSDRQLRFRLLDDGFPTKDAEAVANLRHRYGIPGAIRRMVNTVVDDGREG